MKFFLILFDRLYMEWYTLNNSNRGSRRVVIMIWLREPPEVGVWCNSYHEWTCEVRSEPFGVGAAGGLPL